MIFGENVFFSNLLKILIIKINYSFCHSRGVTMLRFHLMYIQFVCQDKITIAGQMLLLNLINIAKSHKNIEYPCRIAVLFFFSRKKLLFSNGLLRYSSATGIVRDAQRFSCSGFVSCLEHRVEKILPEGRVYGPQDISGDGG
jgi:hypothetical protein